MYSKSHTKVISVKKLPGKMISELALETSLKKKERHSRQSKQNVQGTKESKSCIFLSIANVLVLLEHSRGVT